MNIRVAFRQLLLAVTVALGLGANPVHAAPPPLEAYGRLPSVEDLALSPSGTRFAVLNTVGGERMIMIFDDQGRAISRMKVGDMKIRDLRFVSDDLLLMRRSMTEKLPYGFSSQKAEMWQAIIMPVTLDRLDLVFGNRKNLISATFGYYGTRWVGGRPKAYFGAVELVKTTGGRGEYEIDHTRPGLYEVDLLENSVRQIGGPPPAGIDRDWEVGADGSIIARIDRSLTDGSWVIRNGDGEALASGQNATGNAFLIAAGSDGTTMIFGTELDDEEETRWFEVPLDASSAPVEFLADVDVRRIYTDRKTGRIIGYLKDRSDLDPVFFDKSHEQKVRAVRKVFSKLNPGLSEWTDGMGRVVVHTNGNGDSGTYYLVDLAAGKASPLIQQWSGIAAGDVGKISTVSYTAADGLEMDGILTLPVGAEPKNLPLVMLPHGGPNGHDTAGFNWWAQAFASRGYAVFQPNFRGSTNRDAAFVRAGDGEWGRKMQSDITDGLAELVEQGIVDPKRVCIMGASYGGYAALAGVTLQNGYYRCAVSVAGVSDLLMRDRIKRQESGYAKVRTRSLEQQMGPSSGLREVSPRHNAAKADAPVLLIHGRDDTVVPYNQSQGMADALKDAGKPYEFVELKGEDHWLSLGETRLAMLEAAVAFVEKHNPPD